MSYVVNVDSWGSNPMYRRGEVVPDDCPYDVEAAAKRGKLLSEEEYQKAHPEWDPEAQAQVEAAHSIGRDVPTAADLPEDPTAGREVEEGELPPLDAQPIPEAARPKRQTETERTSGEPVQVQPPSNPSAPPGDPSTASPPSGGTTRRAPTS